MRCIRHPSCLDQPHYLGVQDRQAVIDKTSRWRDREPGKISVYDMKVSPTLLLIQSTCRK